MADSLFAPTIDTPTDKYTVFQPMVKPSAIKQRMIEGDVIFQGLSSDLPSGLTGIKSYYETDTGRLKKWDGTQWVWVGKSGYTIQLNSGIFNPVDATTYYAGATGTVSSASAYDSAVIVPISGTIKKVSIFIANNGTTGTAETSTLNLRISDSLDISLGTITTNGTTIDIANVNQAVYEYEMLNIYWTTPTWVTNPTNVAISLVVYIEIG